MGWSSFGRLAFGAPDALVTPHAEYLTLGASPAQREREYRLLGGHRSRADSRGRDLASEPIRRDVVSNHVAKEVASRRSWRVGGSGGGGRL